MVSRRKRRVESSQYGSRLDLVDSQHLRHLMLVVFKVRVSRFSSVKIIIAELTLAAADISHSHPTRHSP